VAHRLWKPQALHSLPRNGQLKPHRHPSAVGSRRCSCQRIIRPLSGKNGSAKLTSERSNGGGTTSCKSSACGCLRECRKPNANVQLCVICNADNLKDSSRATVRHWHSTSGIPMLPNPLRTLEQLQSSLRNVDPSASNVKTEPHVLLSISTSLSQSRFGKQAHATPKQGMERAVLRFPKVRS